jgi:hypothetical protein
LLTAGWHMPFHLQKYEKLAAADKVRYEKEMAAVAG